MQHVATTTTAGLHLVHLQVLLFLALSHDFLSSGYFLPILKRCCGNFCILQESPLKPKSIVGILLGQSVSECQHLILSSDPALNVASSKSAEVFHFLLYQTPEIHFLLYQIPSLSNTITGECIIYCGYAHKGYKLMHNQYFKCKYIRLKFGSIICFAQQTRKKKYCQGYFKKHLFCIINFLDYPSAVSVLRKSATMQVYSLESRPTF